MKKALFLFLALVVCLSLCGAAQAEEGIVAVRIPNPAVSLREYCRGIYYDEPDEMRDEGSKMVTLELDLEAWDQRNDYLDLLRASVDDLELVDFAEETDPGDRYYASVTFRIDDGTSLGEVSNTWSDATGNVSVQFYFNGWDHETFFLNVYYGAGIGLDQYIEMDSPVEAADDAPVDDEGKTSAAPSTDRELIAPAASIESVSIGPDSTVVQDPLNFVDGQLSVEEIKTHKKDGATYRRFEGSSSSEKYMLAYIDLLSSGEYNFTLKDSDISGSRGSFYMAKYSFDYTGSAEVATTELYDGPSGNATLYYTIEDNYKLEGYVYIGKGLSFEDLGLRIDGQTGDTSLPGESLQSPLYRLSDGSYETEDGRFHVGVNEAVVYRDGTPYTVQASLTRNTAKSREELRIYNFYRNDSIVWTSPYNYPMTGDIYSGRQISPKIENTQQEQFINETEDFLHWNYSDQILGVCHNGDRLFFFPDGGNDFEKAVVRVMNWDTNRGEAVIYLCMTFDSEPYEYEAMAVVTMGPTPVGADADKVFTMSAGSTAEITYEDTEFDTHYDLFTWEILEGSSLIELTNTRSQSCTVYAIDPGQARIKVTYEYGIDGADVLTGNKVTNFKSKSDEYVIVIE